MAHRWAHQNRNSPATLARKAKYNTREHRAAKEAARRLIAAGQGFCWRCHRHIPPGSQCGPDWQTGHNDAGTHLMGPECRRCNQTAAGRKGNRVQRAVRSPRHKPLIRKAW